MSRPSCGHHEVLQRVRRAPRRAGAHPEPRSFTPRHLIEKILASRSALRAERKLVTVLFADVVRSMELAEYVDPEEWHRLLDGLFRILTRPDGARGLSAWPGTTGRPFLRPRS